jgi:hypothetical protein
MKYVIGAILGFMLGAGVEYEYGTAYMRSALHVASLELGNAYGCGVIATLKETNARFGGKVQMPETQWCAGYRELRDRPTP